MKIFLLMLALLFLGAAIWSLRIASDLASGERPFRDFCNGIRTGEDPAEVRRRGASFACNEDGFGSTFSHYVPPFTFLKCRVELDRNGVVGSKRLSR
jgi:hypothetical protein